VCIYHKFTNRFKYEVDNKIIDDVENEKAWYIKERSTRRNELLEHTKNIHLNSTLATTLLNQNWSKTQKVKRDRQKRDLQYELTVQKISELKELKTKQIHTKDGINGVTSFEYILKRNGIGAGVDQTLNENGFSHEDSSAFKKRIESIVESKKDSTDDANDFLTQLKLRTQEKRIARYEKAKKKRRAQIEANNNAKEINSQQKMDVDDPQFLGN
jgi:hypothetical protein